MIKQYVLGMDIGGTNTVFGLVDKHGNIVERGSVSTTAYPVLNDYIDAIVTDLLPLIKTAGGVDNINGMGIGAPNGNYYSGCIELAPNLPWKQDVIPLAKLFRDRLGLPVVVTNDANAAAIGEMTYGAAKGMKDFIMITLGTGVGSGIVANGKLIYGYDGFAGELGHVTVRRGGRLCGCGRKGCLETYCSATGVARTALELLGESNADSLLRAIPVEQVTSKAVYEAAVAGDALAREVFNVTGTMLGQAFADFIAFSAPEAIVLFGGLTKAGDLLLKPIHKALDENIMPIHRGKVKLLLSDMPDADAAVLGSAALAWETE